MNILNTKSTSIVDKINILVYGQAGAGKTYLAATMPEPLIVSAEAGLMSLSDFDIPYIKIDSMSDLVDVYKFITIKNHSYQSIVIDSLSEIAELILVEEKGKNKDQRAAYLVMQEMTVKLIKSFRDLPYHIYMNCRVEKSQDEMGRMLYNPLMPGQKIGAMLPYLFDEVFPLRLESTEGGLIRKLQTTGDELWTAKDRSGKLHMYEEPDLGLIISKIKNKK